MKHYVRRKVEAFILIAALLIGLLPISVGAISQQTCGGGQHKPNLDNKLSANYTAQNGGYPYDYYLCTVCGGACNANGGSEMFVGGKSDGCSGAGGTGGIGHVPDAQHQTCSGGTYYTCKYCSSNVDSTGRVVDLSQSGGGHTAGTTSNGANYTQCMGGYQNAYYLCTKCNQACDQDGKDAVYTQGTGVHSPGSTQYPASWTSANGGYVQEYYICTWCGTGCDQFGEAVVWAGPNSCSNGSHTPGNELHNSNYTSCDGGIKSQFYVCTICGEPCDASGNCLVYTPGTGKHTPGVEEQPANYTTCSGGITTPFYICQDCGQPCDSAGNSVNGQPGDGKHQLEKHDPDYKPCSGGFKNTFYECSVCHQPFKDENATEPAEWSDPDPNCKHTPDQNLTQADYAPCSGGTKIDHFVCIYCFEPCDSQGNTVEWYPGDGSPHQLVPCEADYKPCWGGYTDKYYECSVCHGTFKDEKAEELAEGSEPDPNAKHTPGAKLPPNYTECGGGINSEHYQCLYCEVPCDENGDEVATVSGTGKHTPGNEKHPANYKGCSGGIKEEYYECIYCGVPCNDDGIEIVSAYGSGQHTPGNARMAPNYTSCNGGVETAFYICQVCGEPCDSEGNTIAVKPGDWKHQLKKCASDYTPCGGGIKTQYYWCSVCQQQFKDANATEYTELSSADPSAKHDLKEVQEVPATYAADGVKAHWQCSVCFGNFYDENGDRQIEDMADLRIPKLDTEEPGANRIVQNNLTEVPQAVSASYSTVAEIETVMKKAAATVNLTIVSEQSGAVLLDLVLQVKNSDGTWSAINPEDFPAEGVDTVLAYPDGTDSRDEFVIIHMISHGPSAGTTENMAYTAMQDGLHVHFGSLSPVYILYRKHPSTQEEQKTETTASASSGNVYPVSVTEETESKENSESATTVSPKMGDTETIWIWVTLFLLSSAVLVFAAMRRRIQ